MKGPEDEKASKGLSIEYLIHIPQHVDLSIFLWVMELSTLKILSCLFSWLIPSSCKTQRGNRSSAIEISQG